VTLEAVQLDKWLVVPPEELSRLSAMPFTLCADRAELHRRFADEIFEEIAAAHRGGQRLSLILPIGPTAHYPLLAQRINEAAQPLAHVTFFGMDEWLDWQGRPLPLSHPFSLEGIFRREFLEHVETALQPARDAVIFPSPLALDRSAKEIERRGGVATTYGGVGFQGHIAFNEPPRTRWTPVTLDQLRDSQTRVLPLSIDTLIAQAERRCGGNVFAVPPMAITLGMRELLSADRVRLYLDTGAWKGTILRILLFSQPDVDYPVTLVREHSDVHVYADRMTAASPLRSVPAETRTHQAADILQTTSS
jgi:glucosamine-6-phosphate deaminase